MGEAERLEHADVMEFLHRLAGQHGVLAKELAASRAILEHELADLKREIEGLYQWRTEHVERGTWIHQAEPDIRQLVESTRWVKMTRKFLAWIVGAIVGTLMAISTLEIFIRDHMPK